VKVLNVQSELGLQHDVKIKIAKWIKLEFKKISSKKYKKSESHEVSPLKVDT